MARAMSEPVIFEGRKEYAKRQRWLPGSNEYEPSKGLHSAGSHGRGIIARTSGRFSASHLPALKRGLRFAFQAVPGAGVGSVVALAAVVAAPA